MATAEIIEAKINRLHGFVMGYALGMSSRRRHDKVAKVEQDDKVRLRLLGNI